MRTFITLVFCLMCSKPLAQTTSPSVLSKINESLKFTGDFRFRLEHDWNSRKSDGAFRQDRSRLRYRFRFGLNYTLDTHSSFGGRVRSGNLDDQQGPHVTLGNNTAEFGLTQIGLEKLYYVYKNKWFRGWVGKNTILLQKENELFWNDNVFPEGVAASARWNYQHPLLQSVGINWGHYVIDSRGSTLDNDSYLEVLQLVLQTWKKRLTIYPALYHFNNIGNLPDGKSNYSLSYTLFHLGGKLNILKKPQLNLSADFYYNLQDYSKLDSVPANLQNQRQGLVVTAKLGKIKKKGDWAVHLYYAYLERFAIVDYFAQNDWARWDYSSVGATGSRLSNFQGVELRIVYAFAKKFNLNLRTYLVEQLVAQGGFRETGSRIRLDLNIGF